MIKIKYPIGNYIVDRLVNLLFSWTRLRNAIFDEVQMYNDIDRVLKDPDAMEIALSVYPGTDGYRGWKKSLEHNKYYFNDIPEKSFIDAIDHLYLMESK